MNKRLVSGILLGRAPRIRASNEPEYHFSANAELSRTDKASAASRVTYIRLIAKSITWPNEKLLRPSM